MLEGALRQIVKHAYIDLHISTVRKQTMLEGALRPAQLADFLIAAQCERQKADNARRGIKTRLRAGANARILHRLGSESRQCSKGH